MEALHHHRRHGDAISSLNFRYIRRRGRRRRSSCANRAIERVRVDRFRAKMRTPSTSNRHKPRRALDMTDSDHGHGFFVLSSLSVSVYSVLASKTILKDHFNVVSPMAITSIPNRLFRGSNVAATFASRLLSRQRLFCRFRSSRVNGYAAQAANGAASIAPPHMAADDKVEITPETTFIQGETLNLAADLRTFRPGDKLEIPYEMTVSESIYDFWQSVR